MTTQFGALKIHTDTCYLIKLSLGERYYFIENQLYFNNLARNRDKKCLEQFGLQLATGSYQFMLVDDVKPFL